MKPKHLSPIEISTKGIKASLGKRPTFWQFFALIAMLLLALMTLTLLIVINLKEFSLLPLAALPWLKSGKKALSKALKPRAP